jgi:hypothetical protein
MCLGCLNLHAKAPTLQRAGVSVKNLMYDICLFARVFRKRRFCHRKTTSISSNSSWALTSTSRMSHRWWNSRCCNCPFLWLAKHIGVNYLWACGCVFRRMAAAASFPKTSAFFEQWGLGRTPTGMVSEWQKDSHSKRLSLNNSIIYSCLVHSIPL